MTQYWPHLKTVADVFLSKGVFNILFCFSGTQLSKLIWNIYENDHMLFHTVISDCLARYLESILNHSLVVMSSFPSRLFQLNYFSADGAHQRSLSSIKIIQYVG